MLLKDTASGAAMISASEDFAEFFGQNAKKFVRETAARGNVDAATELNKNFLKLMQLGADGLAYAIWTISGANAKELDPASTTAVRFFTETQRNSYSLTTLTDSKRFVEMAIGRVSQKAALLESMTMPKKKNGMAVIQLNPLNRAGSLIAQIKKRRYGEDDAKVVSESLKAMRAAYAQHLRPLLPPKVKDVELERLVSTPGTSISAVIPVATLETAYKSEAASAGTDQVTGAPELIQPEELKKIAGAFEVGYVINISNATSKEEGAETLFELRFDLRMIIEVPQNFIMQVTGTTDPSELKRSLFFLYFNDALSKAYGLFGKPPQKRGKKAKIQWPPAVSNPSALPSFLNKMSQAYPKMFGPRVDNSGWAILRDGSFRRFKEPANGEAFVKYIDDVERLLNKADEIDPNAEPAPDSPTREDIFSEIASMFKKEYAGKMAVVDWVNDSYSYVTTDGEMSHESLAGVKALSTAAIARAMESPEYFMGLTREYTVMAGICSILTTAFRDRAATERDEIFNNGRGYEDPRYQNLYERNPDPDGLLKNIKQLAEKVKQNDKYVVRLKHVAGIDLDDLEGIPNTSDKTELLAKLKALRESFVEANTSSDLLAKKADESRNGSGAWVIEACATMSQDRYNTIRRVNAEAKNKAADRSLPDHFSVPNLSDNVSLLPHQAEIAAVSAHQPKVLLGAVATGGGKCVVGSTIVNTDSGFLRMDELIQDRGYHAAPNGTRISSVLGSERVSHFFKEKSETIRVSTANGFTIEGTPEHPMLVLTDDLEKEWKRLDHIDIGDRILSWSGVHAPIWGNNSVPDHAARLLGYLLANGHVQKYDYKTAPIARMSSDDPIVQEDFLRCVGKLGLGDREFLKYGDKSAVCNLNREQVEALLTCGMGAGTSRQKLIPLSVRSGNREVVRNFLDAYFACDSGFDRGEILIVVSNQDMCSQLQSLLLQGFDILSSSKKRTSAAVSAGVRGEERPYWHIWIAGEHTARFLEEFPNAKVAKNSLVLRQEPSVMDRTVDVVPWFETVIRDFVEGYRVPLSKPSRYKFKSGIKVFDWGFRQPNQLAKGQCNRAQIDNLGWDRIIPALKDLDTDFGERIETLVEERVRVQVVNAVTRRPKKKWVYDVTVPRSHSFYANGMVSHNTILQIVHTMLSAQHGVNGQLVITKENLIPQMIEAINGFSEGQINAYPLTPEVIESLIKRHPKELGSFDKFVNYIKGIIRKAPNTIFLTSHDAMKLERPIFDDLPKKVNYLTASSAVTHFALLVKAIGFESVSVDEFHLCKNFDSGRSKGVQRAMTNAEQMAFWSGTFANNVPADWHGAIAAIDPSITGSFGEFKKALGYDQNSVTLASRNDLLHMVQAQATYVEKNRSDWMFLLPESKTKYHTVIMTEKQSAWYMDLLNAATAAIDARYKKEFDKRKGGNGDNEDGESVDEQTINIGLIPEVVALEMFTIAPDYDGKGYATKNLYTKQAEAPTGDDLISPHVKKAGEIINQHFASGRKDKVIVYSYHQCAVDHFVRHLPGFLQGDLASKVVVYRAGNDAVVRRFKEDPEAKILIAAEVAIATGFDLQVAGRIIRTQALWAPGAVEQALARILRPDLKSKVAREKVDHDWIMAKARTKRGLKPTFDVMKAANMFAKELSTKDSVYGSRDTPDGARRAAKWEAGLTDAGLERNFKFSVNPDTIRDFTDEMAEPFFKANAVVMDFEHNEGQRHKHQLAKQIEQLTGEKMLDGDGKIIDLRKFIARVVRPVGGAKPIPSSSRVYTPWVENMKPADPEDVGYAMGDAGTKWTVGQHVKTEYGPGKIAKVGKQRVTVSTAFGPIELKPTLVAFPATDEGKAKLKDIYEKHLQKHALAPPGKTKGDVEVEALDAEDGSVETPKKGRGKAKTGEAPTPKTLVDKPKAKKKKAEESEDDADAVVPHAVIADGMPALVLPLSSDLIDQYDGKADWHKIGPFVAYRFTKPSAATEFLEAITDRFAIGTSRRKEIESLLSTYVKRRKMLADHKPDAASKRAFFLNAARQEKTKKGDASIKPYLMTWGTEVRLVFPKASHSPTVFTKLTAVASKTTGVQKVKPDNAGFHIAFFNTPAALEKELKLIEAYCKANDVPMNAKAMKAASKDAAALYKSIMATKGTTKIVAQEKPVKKTKATNEEVEETKPTKKAAKKKPTKGKVEEKKPSEKPATKKSTKKDKVEEKKPASKSKAKSKDDGKKAPAKRAAAKAPAKKTVEKKTAAKAPAKKPAKKKKK